MRFMLDTNIIAYAKNNRPETVLKRLMQHNPEDYCISSITLAKLEFGVYNSARPEQNQLSLMTFLARIEVVPFEADAAREYGIIRADLTKNANLIGANDLLLAAHAKALGLRTRAEIIHTLCLPESAIAALSSVDVPRHVSLLYAVWLRTRLALTNSCFAFCTNYFCTVPNARNQQYPRVRAGRWP